MIETRTMAGSGHHVPAPSRAKGEREVTGPYLLATAAAGVILVNLPFGYWRAGLRRLTPTWFVAVHAPVPLVVAIRLLLGIRFRIATVPLLAGAFFVGQLLGGRLRPRPPSSRSDGG